MSKSKKKNLSFADIKQLTGEALLQSATSRTDQWINILQSAIDNDTTLHMTCLAEQANELIVPLLSLLLDQLDKNNQRIDELILFLVEIMVRQSFSSNNDRLVRDKALALLVSAYSRHQELALRILPYFGELTDSQKGFVQSLRLDPVLGQRAQRCMEKLSGHIRSSESLTFDSSSGNLESAVCESRLDFHVGAQGTANIYPIHSDDMPSKDAEDSPPHLELPSRVSTKQDAIAVIQEVQRYLSRLAVQEMMEKKLPGSKTTNDDGTKALRDLAGDCSLGIHALRGLITRRIKEREKIQRPEIAEMNRHLKIFYGVRLAYKDAKVFFDELRKFCERFGVDTKFENKTVRVSVVQGKNEIAVMKIKEIGSSMKKRLDTAKYEFPQIKVG